MARFNRLDVLNSMVGVGVIPVFYNPDLEKAASIIKACRKGGAVCVEFTNRGDHAFEIFSALESRFAASDPGAILGVGSVIDPGTASLYINAGAAFVVGPVLNAEVARACNRRKIAYSPGCGSVSEISAAEELGCEVIKIFPGSQVGGPAFVKAVKGPMPWTSIMPTGGVDATEESIGAWIGAGCICLGLGSNLITKELVAAGNWEAIAANVAKAIALVKKVRGK
ncbi:MAG TPA: bifunctional 4-hydroxy-2-oxoglutarate aldolase/2-dehydro-3-deoxy-phosphogluconate aldolase [Candidatus Glassbacteria bacterium]|nr:bifunctional 4-hydroxy-2-oxoglutarate aldolase/2-dehydro-3-deoxy-phosphogluconate aldolase [Candidatus Glassbacteria bacterium]